MEIRGRSTAFSACMTAVLAGAEAWDWVTEAQCSDALKFWVREVKGLVFGGRAVDGTIASATGREETGLLVFGKVKPYSFGLKIVEDVRETALKGFDLMVEWLLKVKESTGGLSCAGVSKGVPKGADPTVSSLGRPLS